MAFDNIISRSDAAALIPEDVASEVLSGAEQESAALTLFRKVTMSRKQTRMPVLSALPTAYFVDGDTGLKQTTEQNWSNKYLNAEELACIVPIPQAVLDDSDFDIWAEVKPKLAEAMGRAIDAAVFFGVNAPAVWPDDITTAATAAGNTVNEGASAANGGFQEDVDQLLGAVEDDGFDPSGLVFRRNARGKFRRARSTTGERLDGLSPNLTEYLGLPILYTMSGLWPNGAANAAVRGFAGDFASNFVIGVRRDLEWTIAKEAVITDDEGNIVYNLFQQDMVAMRVTMRVAWQVANVINNDQSVEANRYPAAVLRYSN